MFASVSGFESGLSEAGRGWPAPHPNNLMRLVYLRVKKSMKAEAFGMKIHAISLDGIQVKIFNFSGTDSHQSLSFASSNSRFSRNGGFSNNLNCLGDEVRFF